jgi:tetratricopeptide (TPR) repeat protein
MLSSTTHYLKCILFTVIITGFFLVCGCVEDRPIDVRNISTNLTMQAEEKEQNGSAMEALSLYDAAIRLESSDPSLWLKVASLLSNESLDDEAIIGYSHVLTLDPKNSTALIGRGRAYAREGDLEKAYADMKNATILDPNNAATHAGLADVHVAMNETRQALAEYGIAINLSPKNYEYYVKQAEILYNAGRIMKRQSHTIMP